MLSLVRTPPIDPPPAAFNLAAYVLRHAQSLQDKTALAVVGADNTALSYRSLEQAVLGTATGLLRGGLKRGDRVLLQLGNTADFPLAYLGAIAAGILPVLLSAQLTDPEVGAVSAIVRPAATLIANGLAAAAVPQIPVAALLGFRSLPPAAYDLGDPGRPAYIIFTSGTSGKPQAVVHAHRAIWARRMMYDGWYGLCQSDRVLHAGAFNWSFTLGTGLLDPWSVGATAMIPAADVSHTALPQALADHKVTIFAAAPGVYRRLLKDRLPALPELRHGLAAGETLDPTLRYRWRKAAGCDLHEAFGMSECSTFVSSSPTRPAPEGSVGYPQAGRTIAVIGADGPVTHGETGTLAIHKDDPGLMLGYLDAPEATAARYQGEWFLTGDQVQMAPDGALTYAGRTDDMMNAGGFRVSPVEVEAALMSHPEITDAAACAVHLRRDLRVIAAFYVASDVIDEDALRDFLACRLARYKCPRILQRCDSLPRGSNNKLLRRVLRAQWEAEHGQA